MNIVSSSLSSPSPLSLSASKSGYLRNAIPSGGRDVDILIGLSVNIVCCEACTELNIVNIMHTPLKKNVMDLWK